MKSCCIGKYGNGLMVGKFDIFVMNLLLDEWM